MTFNEKFIDRNIAELSKFYDLVHGVNVNTSRMIPLYIDGLKLVARRLLYIIYLKDKGKNFRKVASISGETIAKLHHHSPAAVTSCLVGLAQWWNNNIPLIEGFGNYGSISGDRAGADRYIQARLSDYAYDCFFSDWKESAVDMTLAADEESMEPMYLPAKYPSVLINGSLGIGYGRSCNLPPFNFKEVVEATIKLLNNPEDDIILIPDSPTGCDVISGNFKKITDSGSGVYSMRCKYTIDDENNIIKITNIPYQVTVNSIRERIADIKEKNGFPELIGMQDHSGNEVDLRLKIKDNINPYKFMQKLIDNVGGLETSYPVNITVTNDYKTYDLSIKELLKEWIRYRRDQVRVKTTNKRTTLLAEQRTNDVKIFLLSKNNLEDTIKIFRSSRNRKEIESRLVETYKNSEIRMDSLQAKVLSDMRFHELCIDTYENCLKRRDELIKEIEEIENILNMEKGIDKVIVNELKEGIKKYGTPRKSNVVPSKISSDTEVVGSCILQLSSDGMILRKPASNVYEEPIPADSNGFAVKVENDSAFIAIDENGLYSFIKVKEIPIDNEVPLNRYIDKKLSNIISLLPYEMNNDTYCTLISKNGSLKKIRVADMKVSKKPCIELIDKDKLIRGILTEHNSSKDILIYTKNGMGQRLDPNDIRILSPNARGTSGFKLQYDDEIIGCYSIISDNQYLLYVTIKGKMRLNLTSYLPKRDSKHDRMVNLINLPDRDKLFKVIGVNKHDSVQVFLNNGTTETINIKSISESTMNTDPKKIINSNTVSNNIVKVKIM